MGHLTVANVPAVQPHIEAGIDTLEIKIGIACLMVPVPFEVVPVGSAWIVLRHIRRIKREWISDVGVLVRIIASHLP